MLSFSLLTALVSCNNDDEENDRRDNNLAFLNRIKEQPGIRELGDSVMGYPNIFYKIIEESNSLERPVIGNIVTIDYQGWLYSDTVSMDTYVNGTLLEKNTFDSGANRSFKVGSNIEGFDLILQHMPLGSKWRVFIPYNLGYGSSGNASIPSYSTLIFDIKLLKIKSEN